MRYSCGNCYHYARSFVDKEPCVSCKQRSHFLPEPEYSRQAILALEKELKIKYGYDDERINHIIDSFNVKMELKYDREQYQKGYEDAKANALELIMKYVPDDDGTCSNAGADLRELLDEIENL